MEPEGKHADSSLSGDVWIALWGITLAAWPVLGPPQCQIFFPIAFKKGVAASTASFSPPHCIARHKMDTIPCAVEYLHCAASAVAPVQCSRFPCVMLARVGAG